MCQVLTHHPQAILSKYFVIFYILSIFYPTTLCVHQFESKYYGGLLLQNSESKSTGMWDTWQKCNEGRFVRGFRFRIEDSVISGIILYCSKLQTSRITELFKLFSKNEFGTWSRIHFCQDGPAVGFQLKMDPYTHKIVNIRLRCSGPEGSSIDTREAIEMREREIIDNREIDNLNMIWTPQMNCYKRQALCGIQPRFSTNITEELQITDMRMSCCEIMTQAETCTPEDKWELLFEYDNREGINTVEYSYNKKVGVGKIGQINYRENPSINPNERLNPFYEREIFVDHNLESYQFKILKHRFEEVLGHSFKTGFDWNKSPSDTWAEEKPYPIDVKIRPGSFTKVFQITGMCGDYRIRPNKIYQKGVLKDRLRDPENSKEFLKPSDQDIELRRTKRPLHFLQVVEDEIRTLKRPPKKTKKTKKPTKYGYKTKKTMTKRLNIKRSKIKRQRPKTNAETTTTEDSKSFVNVVFGGMSGLRTNNSSSSNIIDDENDVNDQSEVKDENEDNNQSDDEDDESDESEVEDDGNIFQSQDNDENEDDNNQNEDVNEEDNNNQSDDQDENKDEDEVKNEDEEMTPPENASNSIVNASIPAGQLNLTLQLQQIRNQQEISQQQAQQQMLQQQQQFSAIGQQQQISQQQQQMLLQQQQFSAIGQQQQIQGQHQAMLNQMQMEMLKQQQPPRSLGKPYRNKIILFLNKWFMVILSFLMSVFLYLT